MALVSSAKLSDVSILAQQVEPGFHILEDLPAEIIAEIFAQMDSPTQSSFAWTCRKYYQLYFNPDFDTYDFAQKCAQLGYETLLLYCIGQGGFHLFKSTGAGADYVKNPTRFRRNYISATAAKYGHFFERVYDQYEKTSHLGKRKLSAINCMYIAAHMGGQYQLVNKLEMLLSTHLSKIDLIEITLTGGHLDWAEQLFTELNEWEREEFSREVFIHKIFEVGIFTKLPALILHASEQDPHYLTQILRLPYTDIVKLGNIELFEIYYKKGISPEAAAKIQTVVEQATSSDENYFEFVKHLALNHSLRFSFDSIPAWANQEALDWLKAQNFMRFDQSMLEKYLDLSGENYKMQAINWFLKEGGVITPHAMHLAAQTCHVKLLDFLWKHRPEGMQLDSSALPNLIKHWNSQVQLFVFPFRRSVRWLLSKGCTWGESCKEYDQFLHKLVKINSKFAHNFIAEFKPTGLQILA